jgi:hypothetical protein
MQDFSRKTWKEEGRFGDFGKDWRIILN